MPQGAAFCFGGSAMRRVMILGQPGSGKSRLAREIGRATGLPVVHVDHIHWLPGWVERPREQKIALARAAAAGEAWVFEGGISATWPERAARADLIVWLDVGVARRFWRVLRRTVLHWGRNRPDLPEGCREGFHAQTLPFWRWIWDTRHTGREGIARLVEGLPPGKPVVRLRTPAEVRRFVAGIDGRP